MSLAEQQWERVSVHDVVLEWLRSERHKAFNITPADQHSAAGRLLDSPDLASPEQNHARLRLLSLIRCKLFVEIPPDTEWYAVSSLSDASLCELHVIGRCGWDYIGDRNELAKVATRAPQLLREPPEAWPKIILWGHDKSGPFTLIEGNNRLIAYMCSARTGFRVPVLIGLSPTPCFFHVFDRADYLMSDMWAR